MKATATINLDGQSIKLLIEASKLASRKALNEKDSYREMQYVILAATLTNKLAEFHAEAKEVLTKRYCNEEKPAIGVADLSG
ncbi:hypothetical protein AB4114_11335 [Paenibacillus sp. 2RAB27]|uniref:hypothetical protein n=1 Tax=Paenibacillus sp. 2RAB27 TaxID=3232991 RepID=UPI003F9BB8CB